MPHYQDPHKRTLPWVLHNAAAAWRDKPLVRFPHAVITYRDLAERAEAFAGALQELEVRKGHTVAIILDNRWEYLEVWWGICLLGAIEVPVNFGLKGKLLQHVLSDSQARVLIVGADFLPAVEAVLDRTPQVSTIVVIGDRMAEIKGRRTVFFDDLPRRRPELSDVRYSDVAAIMYTSGSTGPAKGVMLSHNFFLRFSEEKVRHVRTGPDDVIYNCYPLFNASGQLEAVVAAMLSGGSVYQARRFSASNFWSDIHTHHCTEFIYMGGILSILDKAEQSPADSDNPIRAGYGVPTPAELHPRFEKRFGCVLVEVYGSTEASTVTFNPYDARKWGSENGGDKLVHGTAGTPPPQHRGPHNVKWTSFAPPGWTNFAPPLTGGLGHASTHHQGVAVLHQRVAHVAQPAFLSIALAVQPGLGIGGASRGSRWNASRHGTRALGCGPAPPRRHRCPWAGTTSSTPTPRSGCRPPKSDPG